MIINYLLTFITFIKFIIKLKCFATWMMLGFSFLYFAFCYLCCQYLQWAELILQHFRLFTYVTTHSTLSSLYLRHSSFSNPSVASPTSQFILQHFFRFFYVTSSSLTSPREPPVMVNRILGRFFQHFRHLTYVTAHSPTLPSLYLRHSSFSNPFPCFTYVTAHSTTILSLLLRHRLFTYVT